MSKLGDRKLEHHKVWSDYSAEYSEWWTLWRYEGGFWRRKKLRWVQQGTYGLEGIFLPHRYTKTEAKKVADHYGIELPL